MTIDELVRGVRIALEVEPLDLCPAFDRNRDERVTSDELRAAVDAALSGCAAADPTMMR